MQRYIKETNYFNIPSKLGLHNFHYMETTTGTNNDCTIVQVTQLQNIFIPTQRKEEDYTTPYKKQINK